MTERTTGRPTTTTYCLLGLLDLQPFSAYELTKYMQRSALADIWPRTEAAIYRESNRLVDAGLARATVERDGGRKRTRYDITAKGRRALAAWLEEPGAPLSFESEVAVKVFFGEAQDLDSLRSHLRAAIDSLHAQAAKAASMMDRWLAGDLEFPERVHYTAMTADLIARINEVAHDWAEDWLDRLEDWDTTSLTASSRAQAFAVIEGLREDVRRLA